MTEAEAKAIISSYGAPANIRGLGKRGYDEILEKLGRSDAVRTTIQGQ